MSQKTCLIVRVSARGNAVYTFRDEANSGAILGASRLWGFFFGSRPRAASTTREAVSPLLIVSFQHATVRRDIPPDDPFPEAFRMSFGMEAGEILPDTSEKGGLTMQKILLLLMVLTILGPFGMDAAFASGGSKRPPKRAILLVAFGTSVPEAQKAYVQVENQAKTAFPDVDIRWAYTSRIIRSKLAGQGKTFDSPETALARMMDEGVTHVAILSLHVIPGEEFHDLHRNAMLFSEMAGGFDRVLIARPLLSSHEDLARVASSLVKRVPPSMTGEDAVLFMGHGTENHPADAIYSALNYLLQDTAPNVFVATVSGYPSIGDILPKLKERKPKKICLMPLMAVAGDHARKDMAGEEKDSWKSLLVASGFRCEIVLTGIAEYPEIVEVWLDHLREVLSRL